jgi:hypothetical protein
VYSSLACYDDRISGAMGILGFLVREETADVAEVGCNTTMERTLCVEKSKKRVGFKPRFPNREGWVRTLEWALPKLRDGKEGKNE